MYTTLKIISRKFLGVILIWKIFSHVGAIFFQTAHKNNCIKKLVHTKAIFYEKFSIFFSNLPDKVFIIKNNNEYFDLRQQNFQI
jgi:hypothetical protein